MLGDEKPEFLKFWPIKSVRKSLWVIPFLILIPILANGQFYNLGAFWKSGSGGGGSSPYTGATFNNPVNALDFQSDKKRIVGGSFLTVSFQNFPHMARYKGTDGSLDTAFTPNGMGFNASVKAIAIDGAGKYVVGGDFTSYNGVARSYVARINSDGTLDTTFAQTGTGLNTSVYTLAIDGSGKIIVGGNFTSYNGTTENYICRLNSDGTLDTTFAQTGTGLNSRVYAIKIDGSGKLIVGGSFVTYNGTTVDSIARIKTDGTLDATFLPVGSGLNSMVTAVAIDGSGKILVGGQFWQYNGTSTSGIARLNTNGSMDGTFIGNAAGFVEAIAIDGSGKIVTGGAASPQVQRFNTDGTIDGTFAMTGTGLNTFVWAMTLDNNGKILAGGSFTSYNGATQNYLVRLNTNGTLDATFPSSSVMNNTVRAIIVNSGNNVITGGDFGFSYPATPPAKNYVARVKLDNSIDSTFTQTGTGLDNNVNAVKVDGSGKAVVGGTFLNYNGTSTPYIARLTSSGGLDGTFAQTGTGLDGPVNALAIDGSGKIVAGGGFTHYNGTNEVAVVRLLSTGAVDATFTVPGFLNAPVYALAIDGSGNVVVGGAFNFIRDYVARFNGTDGTNDATFTQTGSGLNGQVNAVAIDGSGKIIVGGAFTSYNGTTENYIARLTSTGGLDATFAPTGTGLNGSVNSLAIDGSGKIIVGGTFTTYNGVTQQYVARLNSNGTLDATFAPGTASLDNAVNVLAIDSGGDVAAGGVFTQYLLSVAYHYVSFTP